MIYGHNGSGKSTLSELLLSLAEGDCATNVVWEHEDRQRSTVGAGGPSFPASTAVFTRRWVEANLSAFLDGASASAIVTLGREAIDSKEEESQLATEIKRLNAEAGEAEKQRKGLEVKIDELARGVQANITSELGEVDFRYYTKSRFSLPRIKEELRKYDASFPSGSMHLDALKRLRQGAPALAPEVFAPPSSIKAKLVDLSKILAETPTQVSIQALEGNSKAQDWTQQGIELHQSLVHCLFCASEVTDHRRAQLARHFDESWLQIRGNASDLLAEVAHEGQKIVAWYSALSAGVSLSGELQSVYEDSLRQAKVEVDSYLATLGNIESALHIKATDPNATPSAPDWSGIRAPSITVIAQAITEHNAQILRHEEAIKEWKKVVLDHIVGSRSEAFKELEEQVKDLAAKGAASKNAAGLAERRLGEVRQLQFTTKDMADTLTRDLARVYGKDHLSVVVDSDGRTYTCHRGHKPGTDLSDGERTTLSLLYFLRKLEDEQISSHDRSQQIVVIDDPSSSLDREALFATHQWLTDRLDDFGQYIILTHDFSLLRLFIKSHHSKWGTSIKKIREGDADEIRFPRVSFLEMYVASVDGERRSKLGKLPGVLHNNTTEYAYLFSMVMAGIADSEDHERLFLLPNAARRVLEVFASYKAPHRTDFLAQLKVLVEGQQGEPFRDVYDFCNRFSHGEGSESIDVLDARAVHGQIGRCMKFLREVDSEHFKNMCTATGVDPGTLQ